MPITRRDVFNILVNPFVESFASLLEFAAEEIGVKEGGSKGMNPFECQDLVAEVVAKCVEISCKVSFTVVCSDSVEPPLKIGKTCEETLRVFPGHKECHKPGHSVKASD
jgi:hypothetical protein